MNKTFRISVMALLGAAALMAASCTKDFENGQSGELIECTLQADMDWAGANIDFGTKVALNADGVTPNWETGDEILVLGADYKPVGADGKFTLSSGAGTASGKFTGTAYVGQKPTYAIYPASAATTNDDDPVTGGSLLYTAGDKAGTFKAAVMLGTSSDGMKMDFTNACAVLTFNTGDYGKSGGAPAIKSVKVSASYGETAAPLAGAFNIDWTVTPPTISAASSGTETELTVELPSSLQANNTDVYIPIFPLPMESSVAPSMEYVFTNTRDATAEISHNFSDAVAGGTIKNLGIAQKMGFHPDLTYWVDLGAVTKDGKKLFFSKYNVESIDANGNATFAETSGARGNLFYVEDALSVKTAKGQECRMPTISELMSLFFDKNVTASAEGDVITLTSKISGTSGDDFLKISSAEPSLYRCSITEEDGWGELDLSYFGDDLWPSVDNDPAYLRLVTVLDEEVPESDDFEVYWCGGTWPLLCSSSNDLSTINGSPNSYGIHPTLVFSNGYRHLDYSFESDNFELTWDGEENWPVINDCYHCCFSGDGSGTIKRIKTGKVIEFSRY